MLPSSRATRRGYRRQARALLFLAVSALLAGAGGLLDPSRLNSSAVGRALANPVDDAWLAAYTVGGALTLYGIARVSPVAEAFGEWLLLAAFLVNAGAILVVRGPVAGAVTAAPVLLAAWVVRTRIEDLEKLARLTPRLPPERRRGRADRRPAEQRVERRQAR